MDSIEPSEHTSNRKHTDIEENRITEEKTKSDTTDEPNKSIDTNMTLSTKLSTDHLICKSPKESSAGSVKSARRAFRRHKFFEIDLLFLGAFMQIFSGILMVAFGIQVILYDASLSQVGGGLWGGCLAILTGGIGVLASARQFCPLKTTANKIVRTVYLALSLISLAVSQLVVVLAATGLARDINYFNSDTEDIDSESAQSSHDNRYLSIVFNILLVVAASGECICATLCSYKSARAVCPCFRSSEDNIEANLAINNSHALVSSWLGKHSPPPQLYIVAASPSSLGKSSKLSGGLMTPIFAYPPQSMMTPSPMFSSPVRGVPLIPAPLGPVPSPIIPPLRKEIMRRRRKRHAPKVPKMRDSHGIHRPITPTKRKMSKSRSKSKSRESLREEDVVKTYTGLDRTIAEEFIDFCDSRNVSLCSDSSCTSGCVGPCNNQCSSHSDITSRDYSVQKF